MEAEEKFYEKDTLVYSDFPSRDAARRMFRAARYYV